MPNPMIAAVVEIEREAEQVIARAGAEADQILAAAREERQKASAAAREAVAREIAGLEAEAGRKRQVMAGELTASGATDLARIKNISSQAFDDGVGFILAALAGQK